MLHHIEPDRRTLHGAFSRDWEPILTIDSGDTVRYRTLDAGWHTGPFTEENARELRFQPRDEDRDNGHALCGPIAIRGAAPGTVLEVDIDVVRPADWGWSCAGGWSTPINDRLGVSEEGVRHFWSIDVDGGTARNQHGHQVRLNPFMGVMGMPAGEPATVPSWPPRPNGGNLDCKELRAGSKLFLPIAVAGGLFSVGDGHAAQGDGEVSSTAIECPMECVELTFRLRDELRLTTPRAWTPDGWICLGFHESLDEATLIALEDMLNLISEQHGLNRPDALALASLTVDMRITQIVNGIRGVHAVLPHGAIGTGKPD